MLRRQVSSLKGKLTNEEIKSPYDNAFKLVNDCIYRARHCMQEGRELSYDSDVQNYSYQVLCSVLHDQKEGRPIVESYEDDALDTKKDLC